MHANFISQEQLKFFTRTVLLGVCATLLVACGDNQQTTAPDSPSGELPPGFMDEPPPPPVSDTLVLSGGTLVMEKEIPDSVVFIKDGKLLAFGKRGEVDMPNDSIGYDLRGSFIKATSELKVDEIAQLAFYSESPDNNTSAAQVGGYQLGELSLPAPKDG